MDREIWSERRREEENKRGKECFKIECKRITAVDLLSKKFHYIVLTEYLLEKGNLACEDDFEI